MTVGRQQAIWPSSSSPGWMPGEIREQDPALLLFMLYTAVVAR
jgi:hypothetical protein